MLVIRLVCAVVAPKIGQIDQKAEKADFGDCEVFEATDEEVEHLFVAYLLRVVN